MTAPLREQFIYSTEGYWELDISCGAVAFRVHIYKDETHQQDPWVTNIYEPEGTERPASIRNAWYPSREIALDAVRRQVAEAAAEQSHGERQTDLPKSSG